MLEHVRRLNSLDGMGGNLGAAITAILAGDRRIWTGDEDGRVVSCLLFSPFLGDSSFSRVVVYRIQVDCIVEKIY